MSIFKKILKILYYPYYIKSLKAFRYLSTAAIEIVGICNYQCAMCGFSGERKKGFMSYNLFYNAINQLKKFKVESLALHLYGEPLLHPRLTDVVKHAIRNGHKIDLYTNGSLLNVSLAEHLIHLGVNQFHISFIPNKKEYEEIFKGSHYETVMDNMSNLIKIINKNKLYLQIRLMTDDEEEYIVYKNMCLEMFGKSISVFYDRSPFLPVYGQKMDCRYSNNYKYIYPCELVYRSINILWNGDVVPCCFDVNGLLVMGNIKENCLSDIWNNERYVELRRRLAKNERLTEPCLNCFARYYKEYPLISFLKRKITKL